MKTKGNGKGIRFLRQLIDCQSDDCVLWPFNKMPNGYGSLSVNGESHYSHRLMCAMAHGEPPTPEHHAAHSCHTRHCVNPRHLSWKTLSENMLDKRANGTANNAWWGHKGKLTPEQVAEIRALKGKETQAKIAARFSITESNVRAIHTGKTHTGKPWDRKATAQKAAETSKRRREAALREAQAEYWRDHS